LIAAACALVRQSGVSEPSRQAGTSLAGSKLHLRGSSINPSFSPSISSHLAIAFSATRLILAAETGTSVNAFWFQIAPIVNPV